MIFRKSVLKAIAGVALVVVLGLFTRVVYLDAIKMWDDSTTWQNIPFYKVPAATAGVSYSTIFDAQSQILTFSTPYCTLYKSEVKDHTITYSCSLVSPQVLELDGKVKTFEQSNDVMFTYTYGTDPAPEVFLQVTPIDELTMQVAGEEPRGIALSFEVQMEKPNKSLAQVIRHLVIVKQGKKDTVPSKLLSWSVDDAKNASILKAGGSDQYAENWRSATLAQIRKELIIHHADTLSGQQLLNAVRDVFQYQNSKCSNINGEVKCSYEYSSNGATALVFYLYAEMESNSKDSLYLRIANAMKMYTYPFYLKYNPNYTLPPTTPCPAGQISCISDFQQASTFQYSSCPIENVVKREWDAPQITYFTDYISLRRTHPVIVPEKDMLKELELVKTELDKGGFPDVQSATKLNQVCYSLILSKSSNSKVISELKTKYYSMFLNKLTEDQSGAYIDEETGDFDATDFIVTRTSKNTYVMPYIADTSVILSRDENNLETVQTQIDNKSMWGNLPLSFALSYLSLAQHE